MGWEGVKVSRLVLTGLHGPSCLGKNGGMRAFARAISSEFKKLLTLRFIRYVVAATTVLLPLYALLTTPSVRDAISAGDPTLAPGITPESVGFDGIELGQVFLILLGSISVSSEYQFDQLKVSLLAVPNRLRLLGAKVLAVGVVSLLLGMVVVPLVAFISQLQLGEVGILHGGITVSYLLSLGGAIVSWAAIALLSFALTIICRQALTPLLILIVTSQFTLVLVHLMPGAQYLPFSAGVQLYDPSSIVAETPSAGLGSGVALLVLTIWVVAFMALAGFLFQRRGVQT